MLEELGLTPIAEQIYLELLENPWQASTSLPEATGLSREKVETAFSTLRMLGILQESESGLFVVPPATATHILLAQQETSLAALQEFFERSQVAASEFIAKHPVQPLDNPNNERVFGAHLILKRIASLAEQTKIRMDTFAPGKDVPLEHIEASQRANLKMYARNVHSRTVYLATSVKNENMLANLKWLAAHGSEVRLATQLPIRMIISDQKVAVLPLDITDGMNGILIVRDISNVSALCALFESIWNTATPFVGESPTQASSSYLLTERDRQILSLLAEGSTDKKIAMRMGLQERTVRSACATLARKLGARSRFELGYKAAMVGWHPSSGEDIPLPLEPHDISHH